MSEGNQSHTDLLLDGILGTLREIAAHLKTLAEAAERAHPDEYVNPASRVPKRRDALDPD